MNRVRFDMHCHTAEGSPDAKVKILDYIDLLKQRGFHGMLVTDHDSYSGYKAYLRQKDKVKDFSVLRGIEYDTFDYGHFLIVLPSDTPEEVYDLFEHRGMALIRVIWLARVRRYTWPSSSIWREVHELWQHEKAWHDRAQTICTAF